MQDFQLIISSIFKFPFYNFKVPAGFSSPADDHMDRAFRDELKLSYKKINQLILEEKTPYIKVQCKWNIYRKDSKIRK